VVVAFPRLCLECALNGLAVFASVFLACGPSAFQQYLPRECFS
jgi:hypothetical protein